MYRDKVSNRVRVKDSVRNSDVHIGKDRAGIDKKRVTEKETKAEA